MTRRQPAHWMERGRHMITTFQQHTLQQQREVPYASETFLDLVRIDSGGKR